MWLTRYIGWKKSLVLRSQFSLLRARCWTQPRSSSFLLLFGLGAIILFSTPSTSLDSSSPTASCVHETRGKLSLGDVPAATHPPTDCSISFRKTHWVHSDMPIQ